VLRCHSVGTHDAVDDDLKDFEALCETSPTSEVRQVDPRGSRLVVDTGLRGADAEAAWVTVTDDNGTTHFEGPPSADGCVDVSFESAPQVRMARVRLETARRHREAEVELKGGWTAHRFAD
jgi:hypothetical protein